MADAATLLHLPMGPADFRGALYQPLLPWKYRFRHAKPGGFPWSRHPHPEPMSSREVAHELRHKHKQPTCYDDVVRWEAAAKAWVRSAASPCAFGYVRVSHEKSAQSGISFEIQIESIFNYYQTRFAHEDVDLGPIFCDSAVSGRYTSLRARRGGMEMSASLHPGDHIMFYRLDRGLRSVRDASTLWEDVWKPRGITPHFLDMRADLTTSAGKSMFYIATVMAENESDWKSERNKAVAQRLKSQGRPVNGNAGIGWKLARNARGVTRIPDMEQRAVLHEIAQRRDVKLQSWTEISDAIERRICEYEGRTFKKSAFFRYKWSRDRVRKCYEAWHRLIDAGFQEGMCQGPCCQKGQKDPRRRRR